MCAINRPPGNEECGRSMEVAAAATSAGGGGGGGGDGDGDGDGDDDGHDWDVDDKGFDSFHCEESGGGSNFIAAPRQNCGCSGVPDGVSAGARFKQASASAPTYACTREPMVISLVASPTSSSSVPDSSPQSVGAV